MSDDTFNHIFGGSSGLFDDGEVTFTECRFIKDPGYTNQDGDLMPVFATDLVTDDPDVGESGTLENQFFSIGKGWEIEDGGAKVAHESGKEKGFNKQTYLQAFLIAMMETEDGKGADKVRERYEATGLTPQTAGFWEGLRVHVEQQDYTTGGFKDVEKKTRGRLMPIEVLGWDGAAVEKPAAPVAKKAPAKKAPVKKAPAKAEPEAELSPYATARAAVGEGIAEAIRAIADEVTDTDEFMERCYAEIDGIDADDNIQLLVDDVESEDSIWAEAVAAAG